MVCKFVIEIFEFLVVKYLLFNDLINLFIVFIIFGDLVLWGLLMIIDLLLLSFKLVMVVLYVIFFDSFNILVNVLLLFM